MQDKIAAFSDFYEQTKAFFETIIPFKEKEIIDWERAKEQEINERAVWYDTQIKARREELKILQEHAAALYLRDGPSPPELPGSGIEEAMAETIAVGWPGGPLYVPKEDDER